MLRRRIGSGEGFRPGEHGLLQAQELDQQEPIHLHKLETWDAEGQLLKQAEFGDFQQVDKANQKWIAMRARARNIQTGHTTDIVFSDYRVDPAVSGALFTTRSLEFGS